MLRTSITNFANLSHDELRAEVVQLARQERQATATLIAPLASERYKTQFTASKALLDKLRYAQDLLRHVTPSTMSQSSSSAHSALSSNRSRSRSAA